MGRRIGGGMEDGRAEKHKIELRKWNNAIADVVNHARLSLILPQKYAGQWPCRDQDSASGGLTVARLAEYMHYSRSTLTVLLNQKNKPVQRLWTLDNLTALADALGCNLSDIIAEAERRVRDPESEILLFPGTDPHTQERLQLIINSVLMACPDSMRKLLRRDARVCAFEYGSRKFCDAYYEGIISDRTARSILADASRCHKVIQGEAPLWGVVGEVYDERIKRSRE